jgi:hypothetical protein
MNAGRMDARDISKLVFEFKIYLQTLEDGQSSLSDEQKEASDSLKLLTNDVIIAWLGLAEAFQAFEYDEKAELDVREIIALLREDED